MISKLLNAVEKNDLHNVVAKLHLVNLTLVIMKKKESVCTELAVLSKAMS